MYPLTKLIYDRIGNDHAKKKELMRKLGFTKYSEAEGTFIRLINGQYTQETLEKLRTALDVAPEEFDGAVEETNSRVQIEKEKRSAGNREAERASFLPYIEVKFERFTPTGFMNAMRASHFREVRFESEMSEKPLDEQIQLAEESFRTKYGAYGAASDLFPTLGRILEARYYYEFEEYFVISRDTEA